MITIIYTLLFVLAVIISRHLTINAPHKRAILAAAIVSAIGLSACEALLIGKMNMTEITRFEVKGDKLYVAELLNSKTFGQIQRVVGDNPQVKTLVFTAMEGSIDDETTFKMGRWIRKQGLSTHLTARSVIASGAVDLYLSGVNRTMEDGAKLGVHSWSDGIKEAADFPRDSKEHALNKDYIVAMDVTEDFYWFTIYEAPADSIHWMTNAEITKYGLATAPFLKGDSAADIPFEDFEQMRASILED